MKTNIYVAIALVLILTGMTVILVLIGHEKQEEKIDERMIIGDSDRVAREIATLSQVCWKEGKRKNVQDLHTCYRLDVETVDGMDINKDQVERYIEIDERYFEIPAKIDGDVIGLELNFVPSDRPKVMFN